MFRHKFISIFVISIFIGFSAQQTSAQLFDFYSSPGYSTLISNLIDNSIWNSSMEKYTKNYSKRNKGNSGVSKPNSSVQTSPPIIPAHDQYPAVQFKSTGTRLTLQEYLDSVQISPQEKAELKSLILEIFKQYETAAADKSYPNDWALALVSYIALNSRVYHGITEKPSIPFEQNLGLRDIVAKYAADNDIFKNVSDRQKQELYELLVMTGGLTHHFYTKAVNEKNAEELKTLKIQAEQHLKLVGIKP